MANFWEFVRGLVLHRRRCPTAPAFDDDLWMRMCLEDQERRVEAEWQRIRLEDLETMKRNLTMNNNGTVAAVTKEKGEMCVEGWRALGGGASAEDVQGWVQQKYGVEVSVATIRKVKPDDLKKAGSKKDNGTAGGEVTATELRTIKGIAAEGDGLAELEALLTRAQAVADAAGSLERAREVVSTLKELIS